MTIMGIPALGKSLFSFHSRALYVLLVTVPNREFVTPLQGVTSSRVIHISNSTHLSFVEYRKRQWNRQCRIKTRNRPLLQFKTQMRKFNGLFVRTPLASRMCPSVLLPLKSGLRYYDMTPVVDASRFSWNSVMRCATEGLRVFGHPSNFLPLTVLPYTKNTNTLRGFTPPANYTDRASAACRRS
jgi:hypothetical protein